MFSVLLIAMLLLRLAYELLLPTRRTSEHVYGVTVNELVLREATRVAHSCSIRLTTVHTTKITTLQKRSTLPIHRSLHHSLHSRPA